MGTYSMSKVQVRYAHTSHMCIPSSRILGGGGVIEMHTFTAIIHCRLAEGVSSCVHCGDESEQA